MDKRFAFCFDIGGRTVYSEDTAENLLKRFSRPEEASDKEEVERFIREAEIGWVHTTTYNVIVRTK